MKKTLLVTLILMTTSFISFSQKKNVNDAKGLVTTAQSQILKQDMNAAITSINEAKTLIDGAVTDPSTSQKYDTWITRAVIYSMLGNLDSKTNVQNYNVAFESLNKAYELDKKKTIKHDKIVEIVSNLAFNYYNLGINSMNSTQYKNAQDEFSKTYELLNFDEGKLFPKNTFSDSLKMKSNNYAGICAYYAGDNNAAITMLERAINNPITAGESNAYITLASAYGKTGNKSKQIETINSGKTNIKNDPNLATAEINYYIESGELDVVVKKINDELASNPNRDDLHFNLGLIDIELIKNIKTEDEEIKNYNSAFKHFEKANQLNPNFKYDYFMGLVSFNAGAIYNNRINQTFEEKEQQKLIEERKKYFDNAQMYYLKVHNYYSSKDKSKLSNSELSVWQQTLIALKDISVAYDNQSDYDKYRDLIQKL